MRLSVISLFPFHHRLRRKHILSHRRPRKPVFCIHLGCERCCSGSNYTAFDLIGSYHGFSGWSSDSSNSYPFDKPAFRISLIACRANSIASSDCLCMGCMEYSSFVVKFKSETRSFNFSLCLRMMFSGCFRQGTGFFNFACIPQDHGKRCTNIMGNFSDSLSTGVILLHQVFARSIQTGIDFCQFPHFFPMDRFSFRKMPDAIQNRFHRFFNSTGIPDKQI